MGTMSVDYHWHERLIAEEPPTVVRSQERKGYGVLTFGPDGGPGELAVYLPSAAAAYALASAVMTLGEQLERQEQTLQPDPERPWVDVPLPLDEHQAAAVDVLANVASAREAAWPPARRFDLEMRGTEADCLADPAQCAEVGCADESCARF